MQEAIAAQIPFLVSHVVPGQEEGETSLSSSRPVLALWRLAILNGFVT